MDIKKKKKKGKKETTEQFYSNFSRTVPIQFCYYLMQEFKPEFLQPLLCMENSCLLIVNIEN